MKTNIWDNSSVSQDLIKSENKSEVLSLTYYWSSNQHFFTCRDNRKLSFSVRDYFSFCFISSLYKTLTQLRALFLKKALLKKDFKTFFEACLQKMTCKYKIDIKQQNKLSFPVCDYFFFVLIHPYAKILKQWRALFKKRVILEKRLFFEVCFQKWHTNSNSKLTSNNRTKAPVKFAQNLRFGWHFPESVSKFFLNSLTTFKRTT